MMNWYTSLMQLFTLSLIISIPKCHLILYYSKGQYNLYVWHVYIDGKSEREINETGAEKVIPKRHS